MSADEVTAPPEPASRRPRLSRTRSVTAWVLVVLISLLFPLSVMTVWVVNTVTNTDHYVETMAPLATNPVVISHASTRLTDELFSRVNVEQKIAGILPKKAKPVAAPLTSTMQGFVGREVNRALSSTLFQKVWNNGNRRVHQTLINALSGTNSKSTLVGRNGNTIVVNIAPIATKVITSLDAKGIHFFDPLEARFSTNSGGASITLLTSDQVGQASGIFNLTKKLKWIVPLATLLLVVAAVAVAVRRRKTLLRATIGGSIGIVLFLVALDLVRKQFITKAVREGYNGQVSGIILDTLLRFLKDGLWLVLGILVFLAVVQWFVGPARYAVALRYQIARAWRWLVRNATHVTSREHVAAASVRAKRSAGWVREHQSGLRLVGAVVAGVFFVFSGSLTFGGALVTLLILAAYFGLLQLVVLWAGGVLGAGADAGASATDAAAPGSDVETKATAAPGTRP
jgi:hypothetical protein